MVTDNAQTVHATSTMTSVKKTVKYTTTTVQLKASRSAKAKTLNTIPKGKAVQFLKAYGSWSQVKYHSKTGYVPTKKLKLQNNRVKPPAPAIPGTKTQLAILEKMKENKLISYFYQAESRNYYIDYIPEGKKWSLVSVVISPNEKEPLSSFVVVPANRLGKPKDAEYEKNKADYENVIRTLSDAVYGKNTANSNTLFILTVSESEKIIADWEGPLKRSNGTVKIGTQTFKWYKNDREFMLLTP